MRKAFRIFVVIAAVIGMRGAWAPAFADDTQVVCFGDSATEGAVNLSFPDFLEFFVDPGDGEVVNEGDSGETTDEGYWRALGLVVTFRHAGAKVWTYWEGGNDLIDWVEQNDPYLLSDPASPTYPYRAELDAKLALIRKNIKRTVNLIRTTGSDVVIGTYAPLVPWLACDPSPLGFLTPALAEIANHYQAELNDAIRAAAADLSAPVNDIAADLGFVNGHIVNYHDCNHLNALGNFWAAASWRIAIAPYL
ncbi:SGNH/GDSL hydrolase family protein [bacterium]|nr:SGNH/GDSL hydrolase family protein [bacterium]